MYHSVTTKETRQTGKLDDRHLASSLRQASYSSKVKRHDDDKDEPILRQSEQRSSRHLLPNHGFTTDKTMFPVLDNRSRSLAVLIAPGMTYCARASVVVEPRASTTPSFGI